MAWLKISVLFSIFVCVGVDTVTFLFLFCLSLSDFLALESFCEGCGVGCLFLRVESMYIDVVLDVVILTVNWVHYLNYEAIPQSSSISHWLLQGTSSVQTVSSYRWCDGIPRVVLFFISFGERIHV